METYEITLLRQEFLGKCRLYDRFEWANDEAYWYQWMPNAERWREARRHLEDWKSRSHSHSWKLTVEMYEQKLLESNNLNPSKYTAEQQLYL